MATFKEANQVRVSLKMKLSCYSWYLSSGVFASADQYHIGVVASKIDNKVKKAIPPSVDGVEIKLYLD